jgi:glycosyltransferase involved in cell wall biosynthesis
MVLDQNQKYFAAAPSIDLSLVIAVYNEEAIVGELLSQLDAVVSGLGLAYEIIVVDDGSRDGTLATLRRHVGTIAGLRVVELYRNVGQVAAISAGMSVARGAWVLMMDGDLQHSPADIPRFLAERESGADMIGSYREKREVGVKRKAITALVNRVNRLLLGANITDFGSAFRLIRAEIVTMLKDREGYVHYNTPDLYIRARRFVEIPITQKSRKSGSSKWTLLMLVMFNFDFLVTAMRPVLFAVWGSIIGIAVGTTLYLLHLVGAISFVQALTGPVSIVFTSLLMFMLAVIWREMIRGRQLALGTPTFLIHAIHADGAAQAP